MPRERKTAPKTEKSSRESGGDSTRSLSVIVVIAVVAIAIVVGYLISSHFAGGGSGGQSFESFQSGFYSAPRVAIFVPYVNSSTFAYSDGCATTLIQSIIASRTHHRNMSTIDLLIIANSTSCLGPNGSLGASNGTKVTPIANCIAVSHQEPSIFINYSNTNSTAIRSGNLYTQGDALFLSECGIASELG
jgi:flagellar basal body-associated protein FliL